MKEREGGRKREKGEKKKSFRITQTADTPSPIHTSHTRVHSRNGRLKNFFSFFFFETKAKEERKLYDLVHVGWERIGAK